MSLSGGHLDAMLAAGATAEQIVALVKADIAERDRAAAERREKDAKRQRRHRESRGVTVTNGDRRDPPKENIKPPSSEANASAAKAADPVKEMFDLGLALLVDAGVTEARARNLIGKWRKAKGEAVVIQALIDCRAKSISEPVEWMEARLKSAKWVSASGYEYRGTDEQVLREAERRNDMDTYWSVKAKMKQVA